MDYENNYIPFVISHEVNGIGPLPAITVPLNVDIVGCECDKDKTITRYRVISPYDNDGETLLGNKKVIKVSQVYKTLEACNKKCDEYNKKIIKGWYVATRNLDNISFSDLYNKLGNIQVDESRKALRECYKIAKLRKNRESELTRS